MISTKASDVPTLASPLFGVVPWHLAVDSYKQSLHMVIVLRPYTRAGAANMISCNLSMSGKVYWSGNAAGADGGKTFAQVWWRGLENIAP